MRKLVSCLLCLCLFLGLCGIAAAEEYTAEAMGKNDMVKVTVRFAEGKIEAISAEHNETPGLGDVEIARLIDEVVANQSLNIDATSGATMSHDAFLAAATEALTLAGADVAAFKDGEKVAVATSEYDVTNADIIIVGGGAAGMTAAVTASQKGASVILLEKSGVLGGNTVCAANGINAFDSKVQLADEAYQSAPTSFEDIEALHMNDLNRKELVDAFISASGESIDFYTDLGVNFVVDIQSDPRNKTSNYYMIKPADGSSTAITMVNAIENRLAQTSVKLYKNTEAVSLIQDENGKVTGVTAIAADGSEIEFTGKAVLLATGGFGQNAELIAKVNPSLAGAITDEIAPTTGQGLLMAQAIGADAVDFGEIQTFPSVIKGSGMFMSFGLWMGGEAIYVNKSGERFGKEKFEMGSAILAQEDSLVYGIFDESSYNEGMHAGLIEKGFMVSADSPEELAGKLGINAEGLAASIAKWNEDAASGGVDTLYGRENIKPIDGKLYGYQSGVGAHYFMGGLLINENTQVLSVSGEPIPGLYAAGEVTGGFHGRQRVDGSGLGDSFVFGRIAGNVLAEKVAGEKAEKAASSVSLLTESRNDWTFAPNGTVSEEDLMTILQAGINTPSAINEQPWLFSVVRDPEILSQLETDSQNVAVLILVSVENSNEMKIVDAGMATEAMYLTAKALGYAAKIETSPARIVRRDETGKWAEILGIPESKTCRAAVLIGAPDNSLDAVSHASERKDLNEIVVFVD
ncbi:MAG: flavocytochrome c [Clostridia bacterium]|nr:flavocytochrome c [Clostridia bacterium]